jgi:hypothetical protein
MFRPSPHRVTEGRNIFVELSKPLKQMLKGLSPSSLKSTKNTQQQLQ